MSSVGNGGYGFPILFLETKCDGYNGKLISMAIVDLAGNEFYEVIEYSPTLKYTKGTEKQIIPVLMKQGVNSFTFSCKLEMFLRNYPDRFVIVSTSISGIKNFCLAIANEDGPLIGTMCFEMVVDRTLSCADSKLLLNALEDAKAIKDSWIKNRKKSVEVPF